MSQAGLCLGDIYDQAKEKPYSLLKKILKIFQPLKWPRF